MEILGQGNARKMGLIWTIDLKVDLIDRPEVDPQLGESMKFLGNLGLR